MNRLQQRYGALDGLRTIACIGIIVMHMAANNQYMIPGVVYNKVIPTFTDFVYLFMVLSAFGMCCGYYEKVLSKNIDLVEFYKKRYMKILPFFTCLVILDLLVSFSKESVYEAIADVSLTFGFFPNDIQVIGVGWFLGLVFAFYLVFPFYCVLIKSKKSAWIFFGISLVLNYVCKVYFELNQRNIVFSFCFFLAGGLLYLYRNVIEKMKWYIAVPLVLFSLASYYFFGANTINNLLVSSTLIMLAVGKSGKFLDNKFTHFVSGISLEMYLSHMVVFRAIEKINLNNVFSNDVVQYIVTCVVVITLDVIFAFTAQKCLNLCIEWLKLRCCHEQKQNKSI